MRETPKKTSPENIKEMPKKTTGSLNAPATLIVNLPAEAQLKIDGLATKAKSATRVFASPVLESGKDFFYNLNAEVVRDGQVVSATKRVLVRAGEETRVAIDFPATSLAQR